MGKQRASFQEGFKVAPTVGTAAEGEDSLLSLNNIIASAKQQSEVFEPMKRIATACALQKGYIKPGCSKIRQGGSPDDFLNFATLYYVQRWKKQFQPSDKRMAVAEIQNWIAYVHSTIRFQLILYNREVQEYDFLPMPVYFAEDDESTFDKDLPMDDDTLTYVELKALASPTVLHTLITQLPEELHPYTVHILHYLACPNTIVCEDCRNFVLIGKAFLRKGVEEWLRT